MSRQNSVIAKTKYFQLARRQQKNGRVFYVVSTGHYAYLDYDIMSQVRDLFDPLRNRSGGQGYSWKYSNRKDAEQMYIMATLRWA